jgi:hypothetical protein
MNGKCAEIPDEIPESCLEDSGQNLQKAKRCERQQNTATKKTNKNA